MADLRITCPHCNRDITCDELWVGHELQCPICQGAFTVPAPAEGGGARNPLVPKPPTGGRSRLSVGQAQVPAQTGNRNIPIRKLTEAPQKKKSPLISVLVGVLVVAALGAGGYFGFGWVKAMQDKRNAKAAAEARNSDEGEAGHTANLNKVLDATEPGGAGVETLGSTAGAAGRRARQLAGGAPAPGAAGGSATAPKYTLDINQSEIPPGPVNGLISGSNFVAETVRIDTVGFAKVLQLFQGEVTSPDREMLVYLNLKPGEKLGGQSLVVSNGIRNSTVTQVAKRWKLNPSYPPTLKAYSTGYALKLELGQATNDTVAGTIFLALPDPEQSVIAGTFTATVHQPEPGMQPAQYTAPAATPVMPQSGPGRAAMDRRYGIRR